jgi:hemolysin-activating ACP:hemolysin acyltransferase
VSTQNLPETGIGIEEQLRRRCRMRYIHRNNYNRDAMFKLLGEATSILLNSDRKKYGISSIGAFVFPFVKLNQIEIFYGQNRYPMGYMTWAYVTDTTLAQIRDNPGSIIDIEDLNSGDKLIIIDIVSKLRSVRPVVEKIRHLAQGNYDKIYGIRFDKSSRRMRVREYT